MSNICNKKELCPSLTQSHEQDRRVKLQKIRELGVDPFSCNVDGIFKIWEVRSSYLESFGKDGGPLVKVAGRIHLRRGMGKLSFVTLNSLSSGESIQLAFDHSRLSENDRVIVKNVDLGDIIVCEGKLGATQTGEITIWATSVQVASKSLTPPPDKNDGLKDIETRYRNRHVDLLNPEIIKVMYQRSAIVFGIRQFMENLGFTEVETPIMQPSAGGATARPFTTHHNALNADLFLRIAPELYLKKLIIGGMEKVFEIGKNFRNEGIDSTHNPEFTSMEIYQAFSDMNGMMELCENLIRCASKFVDVNPELDLETPFRKVSLTELCGIKGSLEEQYDYFDCVIAEKLIQPTFVYGMPSSLYPLAKSVDGVAQVFELYMGGMELAPGYTEQNDPDEQLKAFKAQSADGHVLDHDFVDAMKCGMPPTGGMGIGIDRLVAILTNQNSIRDTILFPLLKSLNCTKTDVTKN